MIRAAWVALTRCLATARLALLPALFVPSVPSRTAEWDSTLEHRDAVEAFADEMVAEHQERFGIPGLVLVLVRDGEVVLAKGYGVAELDREIPVVAERTVFPVASLSKTVTATAVMQLADRGLVSLDEDVNRYLNDFQVGGHDDRPITLSHLLTHTSGLDVKYSDVMAASAAAAAAATAVLGPYLAKTLPSRIEPPGNVFRYSNFGISLAGHVVEDVTGSPFPTYVRQEIFDRLGMSRSAFGFPDELERDVAVGYTYREDGAPRPVGEPWKTNLFVPAAGMYTTGSDMARYLLAHLGSGPPLMSGTALETMHRGRFFFHPRAPGVTLGFHQHVENGRTGILHDGDWDGFSSRIYLLPEEGFGLFMSFNMSSPRARASLLSCVLDHFFPSFEGPEKRAATVTRAEIERYAGTYTWSRFPRTGRLKALRLLAEARIETTAASTHNGLALTLELDGPVWDAVGAPRIELVPEEPLVFRRASGEGRVFFEEDERGEITRLLVSVPEILSTGSMQFERAPALASAAVQRVIALVVVPLVVSGLLWLPLYALRALRGRPLEPAGGASIRWAGFTSIAASLLTLAFAVSIGPALDGIEVYGPHRLFDAVLWIPRLLAILTVALVVFAAHAWLRRQGSIPARVLLAGIAASAAVLVVLLRYWNLLDFPP